MGKHQEKRSPTGAREEKDQIENVEETWAGREKKKPFCSRGKKRPKESSDRLKSGCANFKREG